MHVPMDVLWSAGDTFVHGLNLPRYTVRYYSTHGLGQGLSLENCVDCGYLTRQNLARFIAWVPIDVLFGPKFLQGEGAPAASAV